LLEALLAAAALTKLYREPGIYKLTFRRDGKQWGQTIRLRLTP
jgi:hypothetical protein